MLYRDLSALRRVTIPTALILGLFLLVSTPRYHLALTTEARAYVLCAFALVFAPTLAVMLPVLGRASHRYWFAVRLLNLASVAAALAVYLFSAASPIPPGLLLVLACALAASCWPPPRF